VPAGTLCSIFAGKARLVCGIFAPGAERGRHRQPEPSRSRWDMDLIAVALIVGLAAVGLAWITFADRV
jgi:hypothetical protein